MSIGNVRNPPNTTGPGSTQPGGPTSSTTTPAAVTASVAALVGGGADLTAALKAGNLSLEEKLAGAKTKLTPQLKADIQGLLAGAGAQGLDAVARNFLGALVGAEPLKPSTHVGGAARTNAVEVPPAAQQAVSQFREVMKSGQLRAYYDAAIGATNDPALKAKALELFNALPSIAPGGDPAAFVASGMWTTAPRNVAELEKTARYLPGRQVMVPVPVDINLENPREFLSYKEGGPTVATYRARLVGEKGENFLVKVDGKDEPLEVSKAKVFALNQPHDVASAPKVRTANGEGYKLSNWWQSIADYNDPFMKAKVVEAAVKMNDLVAKLDFSKPKTEASGNSMLVRFGWGSKQENMVDIQKEAVQIIHDVIDMKYPDNSPNLRKNGREHSSNCGRAAVRGIGMCREQASVMMAMLAPFQKALGVDAQFIDGGNYRNVASGGKPSFTGSEHGWLQVSYRPSTQMFIIDRTWGQCNLTADVAYSGRRGDRYPSKLESFMKQKPVSETDVNCSGELTVNSTETQFPKEGEKVGRENHVRNTQWNTDPP